MLVVLQFYLLPDEALVLASTTSGYNQIIRLPARRDALREEARLAADVGAPLLVEGTERHRFVTTLEEALLHGLGRRGPSLPRST